MINMNTSNEIWNIKRQCIAYITYTKDMIVLSSFFERYFHNNFGMNCNFPTIAKVIISKSQDNNNISYQLNLKIVNEMI